MKPKQKISKTFLSFLAASVLIWSLITLSKEYTTNISLSVFYDQLPQDKLLQKEPTKKIEVSVTGSGFKIISAKLKRNFVKLNASDLSKKTATKYYLLVKNQQPNIQKQLSSGLQIKQLLKDTIYLELGSLLSKKVPLILNLDIQYHVGYESSSAIELIPDSIKITGPKGKITAIKNIHLSELKLNDVKSNFENTVSIVKPANSENIIFSNQTAIIKGTVEKFTEGSFELPFQIKNLPKGVELITYPKTLKIVYKVGLSNFNKINKNSFTIECDYKESQRNNYAYLIPQIINNSSLVKSVKIVPNKVDFLIQK